MFDVEAFVREGWPEGLPMRTGKDAKPGDHELAVMYFGGDFKLIWDPANHEETEAARASYKRLKEKGFAGFKVTGKDAEKGEQIKDFDPEAGRLIMAPPVRGG